MLLTAVAFENMLKAIAVKRGLLAADGGRLRRDVALSPRGGHGLSEIAKNLELELTSTDVDFLQRLEEYVVWAARYPVPELARHSSRAQERALLRMNFSDVELGEDLFDRLLKIALQAA
ncbi:MAG: hypothetical protein K0S19_1460 [Geminicoccaceae bacterium]|jgi:hypothetical protein|nr:hypothetical protein [Geminicoccaceae bacterium]